MLVVLSLRCSRDVLRGAFHRPLLLQLGHRDVSSINRPFRFIASWILHDNFSEFVRDHWEDSSEWVDNINSFSEACREWNRNVFGHIERRKKKLLSRLDGVNRAIARGGNGDYFENLQAQLWQQLDITLSQEALLWAQKARINWSIHGDRNTKLFHAHANRRRKCNRIDAIQIDDMNWSFDENLIKLKATEYFSNLFKEDIVFREELSCSITFPSLDEFHIRSCGREFHDDEIKEALFSMSPLKSPGPDGLNALFYQSQWQIVGGLVIKTVKHMLKHPEDITKLNETLIVLIPKKDHPECFRDLRPISLCNVSYKIITQLVKH